MIQFLKHLFHFIWNTFNVFTFKSTVGIGFGISQKAFFNRNMFYWASFKRVGLFNASVASLFLPKDSVLFAVSTICCFCANFPAFSKQTQWWQDLQEEKRGSDNCQFVKEEHKVLSLSMLYWLKRGCCVCGWNIFWFCDKRASLTALTRTRGTKTPSACAF